MSAKASTEGQETASGAPAMGAAVATAAPLRRQAAVRETLAMAMRERERVNNLLAGEFPAMPAVDRERAVDKAFDYLYANGEGRLIELPAAFRAQWIQTARLRALRECRRGRYRWRSRRSLSEPGAEALLGDQHEGQSRGGVIDAIEAHRAEYRAEELIASLAPDERTLLEVLLGADPTRRCERRELAAKLGLSENQWKKRLEKTRRHLRELIATMASGELCARREAMLDDYLQFSLATRAAAAGLLRQEEGSAERFQALWLHLEHCDCCRAYARQVQRLEGAVQHALAPPLLLLGACAIWLRDMAALAKAKAISASIALLPARVRAAGTGGGATGAALSGLTGKAAVCAGAALCAAVGLIGTGSVTILPQRPSGAHQARQGRAESASSRVSHELHTSPPRPSVEPSASAPATSGPARRAAPALVLHPLPAQAAGASAAELPSAGPAQRESPALAHLPAPEGPAAERPPAAGSAGCQVPGELGC